MINKFRNLFRVHLHFSKKSAWVLLALLVAFTLIFEKASALEYDDFDDTTRQWLEDIKNDGGFKYTFLKDAIYLIDSGQTIFNGDFGDALVDTAKYVADSKSYTDNLYDSLINGSGSVPEPTVYTISNFVNHQNLRNPNIELNTYGYTAEMDHNYTNYNFNGHYFNVISTLYWRNFTRATNQAIGLNYTVSNTYINYSYGGFFYNPNGPYGGGNEIIRDSTSLFFSFDLTGKNTYILSGISKDFYITIDYGEPITTNEFKIIDNSTHHIEVHINGMRSFDVTRDNTFYKLVDVSFSVSENSVSRPEQPDLSQYKPDINNYGDLNSSDNRQRWEYDNRIYNDIVNYINDIEKETDIKESIAGVDKHDGIYELNENTSVISYPSEFFSAFCLSLSENYQSWFSFDIEEVKWNDIVLFPESHIVIRPESFIPSDLVDVFRYIILFMLVIPWILYLFRTIRGSEVLEDD